MWLMISFLRILLSKRNNSSENKHCKNVTKNWKIFGKQLNAHKQHIFTRKRRLFLRCPSILNVVLCRAVDFAGRGGAGAPSHFIVEVRAQVAPILGVGVPYNTLALLWRRTSHRRLWIRHAEMLGFDQREITNCKHNAPAHPARW